MMFCVATVALCRIPTSLMTRQGHRKSRDSRRDTWVQKNEHFAPASSNRLECHKVPRQPAWKPYEICRFPHTHAEATEATSIARGRRGRRGRRVERVVVVRAVAGAAAARLQRHLAVLQKSNGNPICCYDFPIFWGDSHGFSRTRMESCATWETQ